VDACADGLSVQRAEAGDRLQATVTQALHSDVDRLITAQDKQQAQFKLYANNKLHLKRLIFQVAPATLSSL